MLWTRTKQTGGTYRQALDELSRRLAILELVPYYSANANRISSKFLETLGSANVARQFAQEILREARANDATLMVRWNEKEDRWALNLAANEPNSVVRIEGRQGFNDAKDPILKRLEEPTP